MDTVFSLIKAYSFLAEHVPPAVSRTARIIRTGNNETARKRLSEEIDECLRAFLKEHTHSRDKTKKARSFLHKERLGAEFADVLLELQQVAYWCLVEQLTAGRAVSGSEVVRAIRSGAALGKPNAELAAAARDEPSLNNVFSFIGGVSFVSGLPLDLFARLDLEEMSSRSYLKDLYHGS